MGDLDEIHALQAERDALRAQRDKARAIAELYAVEAAYAGSDPLSTFPELQFADSDGWYPLRDEDIRENARRAAELARQQADQPIFTNQPFHPKVWAERQKESLP